MDGFFSGNKTKVNGVGKFTDLTGHRYGLLVVTALAGRGKRGATKWLCKCDCGNDTVVYAGNIVNRKNTRSCGCLNKVLTSNRNRRDVAGERFGKLVVDEHHVTVII